MADMDRDPSPEPLEELANTISTNVSLIAQFLRGSGHAQPSFSVDSPANFPPAPVDIQHARMELINVAQKLAYLALWPTEAVEFYTLTGVSHPKRSIYTEDDV